MTDERLAELERLCAAATPGPWFPRWGGEPGYVYSQQAQRVIAEVADDRSDDWPRHNSKFIAAARTAVPELLAEVQRLREALDASPKRIRITLPGQWCGKYGVTVRMQDEYTVAVLDLGPNELLQPVWLADDQFEVVESEESDADR